MLHECVESFRHRGDLSQQFSRAMTDGHCRSNPSERVHVEACKGHAGWRRSISSPATLHHAKGWAPKVSLNHRKIRHLWFWSPPWQAWWTRESVPPRSGDGSPPGRQACRTSPKSAIHTARSFVRDHTKRRQDYSVRRS